MTAVNEMNAIVYFRVNGLKKYVELEDDCSSIADIYWVKYVGLNITQWPVRKKINTTSDHKFQAAAFSNTNIVVYFALS